MALAEHVTKGTETAGSALSQAHRLALPVKLYIFFAVIPIFFHAGPLLLSGLRVMLLVLIIPLFFQLISGRFGRLLLVDIAFILHVLWMVISFAVTSPDRLVENVGAASLEFMGGYLVGRAYIRDRHDFIALCKWLGIFTAIFLPLTLYETMTGDALIVKAIRSVPGLTSVELNHHAGRLGLERVQSTFAHPIHYGLYCSVGFSLTFVALQDIWGVGRRILFAGAIGICTFLALSSGALLALIFQIGLITWSITLRKYEKRWWLLFWLCVTAYVVIDVLSNRTPLQVFLSYATFSTHTAYWRMIILDWGLMNIFGNAENNVPSNIMFGIGMSDWIRPWFMHSGSLDNFWLFIGMRYGVPGALFLMTGYLWTIWQIGRRKDFEDDAILLNLRRAWMFTFLGLTFTLFTVHVWTSLYSFVFFIFGTGVWLIETQARTGNQPPDMPDDTASEGRNTYTRFRTRPVQQ